MIALGWTAAASAVEVTVCATVAYDIKDPAGDVWTADGDDVNVPLDYKPARGFYHEILSGLNTVLHSGYLGEGASDAGCATYDLTSQTLYKMKVYSRGSIGGNGLWAWDVKDPATRTLTSTVAWFVAAAGTSTPVNIDGGTDSRWNHLVIVAGALHRERAGLSGHSFHIISLEEGSGQYADEGDELIFLQSSRRKFLITHELGHLVSHYADQGGLEAQVDGSAPMGWCDGTPEYPPYSDGNGRIGKDYHSYAAFEGVAHFYSAWTWNDPNGGDCWYQHHADLDFDLDGGTDYSTLLRQPYPCFGDPLPDKAGLPDEDNWLDDMVNTDDDDLDGYECEGGPGARSSEHDWMRYFWSMVVEQGVPIADLWAIWDEADSWDWDAAPTVPLVPDAQPNNRMEAAADGLGFGAEHDAAKVHGLENP